MSATWFKLQFRVKAFLLRTLYFKTEQALLKGTFRPESTKPSVIFFTVHKAGSSLLTMRFAPFFLKHGYAISDLSSWFARIHPAGRAVFFADEKQKRNVFGTTGVFHCVFRYPFTVPDFEKQQVILVLRDPRDVLVSHFFSTRYSHPVQNPEFFSLKKTAGELTIDQYVLHMAADFRKRYEQYLPWIGKPNVFFARYEDIIEDPAAYEKQLAVFTGLPVTPGEIVSPADFEVDQENPKAHKRKVKAGDHREKLLPETISLLNQEFGAVLEALKYT